MSVSVLVVDDEADIRELMRLTVTLEGNQAVVASDGAEALEILGSLRPDLILLDIRMPGLDGWGFLERGKAEGMLGGIPIVAVSAHADPETARRAVEAGCCEFVEKPFSTTKLRELIAAWVET
jgi:CheY-like chemotaxis protein